MSVCQIEERDAGRGYPRTCPTCKLSGACTKGLDRKGLMARIEALEAENKRLRDAVEDHAEWECTCDPAYYKRKLSAPDCMADLVGDDLRMVLGRPPVCKGRIARAALERKG